MGAQTELIFDGGSIVTNEKGEVVKQLPFFEEKVECISIEDFYNLYNGIEKTVCFDVP